MGLLSPVTVGFDGASDPETSDLGDAGFLRALVAAEVALARAWAEVGVAPREAADAISEALGWQDDDPAASDVLGAADARRLAAASAAGGNPVIPLVGMLRARVPEHARPWLHRGATSQDILDSALMLTARRSGLSVLGSLVKTDEALLRFAAAHRDRVAAARTLTQHAVPTTVGLRAANWARGLERAAARLDDSLWELPAQLGGAGGTLASFVQIGGSRAAAELPAAFAEQLGLAVPAAPWHTVRWPVTELGDALVQVLDALGVVAADVAALGRTEIGELAEGTGGGSSAMPQKRNPVGSVLIRSAALRAPQLGATLHTAAALAVDERPDGAWHAEWPTLRELLRLALGAAGNAERLVAGLTVDTGAVARNLGLTGGLIVAERLALVLGPVIGAERVRRIVAEAGAGGDLGELLDAEPRLAEAGFGRAEIDELLDPANYAGLAGELVDDLTRSPIPEDTQ
ncbi:adenylosuccinate lyase [Leucobacter weissii]|uniref:Adenylosuccinate lyase n=1 Tax=Leucobacter weissii TaxID=1983706 RepID=A0A939MI31_9MICO|nr:adenylosuccinate lyase [Leucobacter weissii]